MRTTLAIVLLAAAMLSVGAWGAVPTQQNEAAAQMTSRRSHAGVVTAPALASTDAATRAALKAIDTCLPRLDPQIDIGYERIAARCPDLPRRLRQSSLAAWLPGSWQDPGNNLSAGSLAELRVLAMRELGAQAAGAGPSVQRLRAVLTEIGHAAREQPSLWSRFKAWLRRVMANRNAPQDAGWLTQAIGRVGLPQALIELVTYGALAAVIGLATLIVVNEVRAAAGVWQGRVRLQRREVREDLRQAVGITRESLEAAPPAQRVRLLLDLITAWLIKQQLLPSARSLTHRELTRAARLQDSDDRRRLEELALAAESVRYGPEVETPECLHSALDSGGTLLDRLEAGVVAPAQERAA